MPRLGLSREQQRILEMGSRNCVGPPLGLSSIEKLLNLYVFLFLWPQKRKNKTKMLLFKVFTPTDSSELILKKRRKTDKIKNRSTLKSHLLLYIALICRKWIVRAKDHNPMACTNPWWEDTNPVPEWQIAPVVKAAELPSGRGSSFSSAGFFIAASSTCCP